MIYKLIAYYSRADENYFSGTKKYIEVGNAEIIAIIEAIIYIHHKLKIR